MIKYSPRQMVWALLIVAVSIPSMNAQSYSLFEKDKWYVESQIGLSYLWSDLAIVDNSLSLEQEPTFENAIKLQMLFNINYSLARNFFVGFIAGAGYLNYEIKESNQQVNFSNYQFGTYFRYYLEITPMISVFTQVGANQNFLESNRFESNSYINAYNDIRTYFKIGRKIGGYPSPLEIWFIFILVTLILKIEVILGLVIRFETLPNFQCLVFSTN